MVSPEAAPFAKTGGLADVLGSLPQALRRRGDEAAVVLPRYAQVPLDGARRIYNDLRIQLGASSYAADIYSVQHDGVPFFLVENAALFHRETFYGPGGEDYPDNHIRFAVFCHAALGVIRWIFRPDVVHCHDWQAALAPVYMRRRFATDPTFMGIRTLFTIHNLGYPGLFPKEVLPAIGLDQGVFTPDLMEFWGKVNFLKGGIVFSDAISTVSEGYAREIQTPELGFGLDGLLRARAGVLHGILNGVDYREWSPETDRFIARNYSAADLSGKQVCKRALLEEFGLPSGDLDRPVIGIVSRFTAQKGFDLIAGIAAQLAAEDLYLVALGAGDTAYEELFRELAAAHPQRIAVRVAYDNQLAHRIEAGSDMFLMPSRYEPCGLNQMYSLRYGTVPIVRATGGLDDTIEETTGFKFSGYTGEALLGAVRQALATWRDRQAWR